MENIKQIKMGALYLDGTAQVNPASDCMGRTIPQYQPDAEIMIAESPADRPECTITWNVVNFDGKQLLIADRALLINVSYEDLEAADFVDGKEITLDGKKYLCRLLRCDGCNKDADEWDRALDATNDSDALWYWEDAAFWVTDLAPKSEASRRVYRGYYSARFFLELVRHSGASLGFRPVLEPLHNDNLIFKVEGKPKAEHLHLEDGRVMCGNKCGARIGGMEVFTRDDAECAYKLFISRCWHCLSTETTIACKNESRKMQELGFPLEEIESMEISAIVNAILLPDTQGGEKE